MATKPGRARSACMNSAPTDPSITRWSADRVIVITVATPDQAGDVRSLMRAAKIRPTITSARAARALGFRYEGLQRQALTSPRGRDDGWMAALLPDDDRTPVDWPVL